MKILNLFAGIGGNRTLWGDKHNIIAIENNQQIAMIYHKRFPNDKVIIGDAYKYNLENYTEFDFIWASPPCFTHSKLQHCQKIKQYPDLRLYELILFLKHFFWGKWVVENVDGYYKLLKPIKIGRHLFWSNFSIPQKKFKYHGKKGGYPNLNIKELRKIKMVEDDLLLNKGYETRKVLRNMVDPYIGRYIFKCLNKKQKSIIEVY